MLDKSKHKLEIVGCNMGENASSIRACISPKTEFAFAEDSFQRAQFR